MANQRASAERCPNCNAFLPPVLEGAKQRRCDYCGLSLRVDPPPPAPPPVAAPVVSPTPAPRSSPPAIGRVWPSLIVPFLVAGSIYWSTQNSIKRQQSARVAPLAERPEGGIEGRLRTLLPGGADAPPKEDSQGAAESRGQASSEARSRGQRSRRPVGDSSLRNELCHISGMEMSAVVQANQKTTAACFASDLTGYPKNVGLTSDWEVELDGLGRVHQAHGRLHLLDYNLSPEERAQKKLALPGPAALRCAQDVIRGWVFPKYSPKDGARMRMRCSFNLVLRDT
jgi:hypothetical protein